MLNKDNIIVRIKILIFCALLPFLYLIFTIYKLQVIRHDELLAKAKKKYTTYKTVRGERGEIFDYEGNLLVGNMPCYQVFTDPSRLGDEDECKRFAEYLAIKFNVKADKLLKLFTRTRTVTDKKTKKISVERYKYALITKQVELSQSEKETLIEDVKKNKFNHKLLYFVEGYKRYYPKGKLLANILGYTRYDEGREQGKSGIESTYGNKLDSNEVKVKFGRTRDGRQIRMNNVDVSCGKVIITFPNGKKLPFVVNAPLSADFDRDGLNVSLSIAEKIYLDYDEHYISNSLEKYNKTNEPLDFQGFYEKVLEQWNVISYGDKISFKLTNISVKDEYGTDYNLDMKSQIEGSFCKDENSFYLDDFKIIETSIKNTESTNGDDIYFTVREPIQSIIEDELEKLCEEWKPKVAYAIMADPKTGDILGIAQRPTFNPNKKILEKDIPFIRMRFATDVFEPGSIMKPISIAGALDNNIVTPNEKIYCEKGRWHFAKKPLRDAGHSYEYLTVSEIVQKSSNIGTAKIAIKMGKNLLYNTLIKFGFGEKTGLNLPGEGRGILAKPNKWYDISISRIPMGQGISTTPVQMVRAYCALANGGYLPKLRLIDRFNDKKVSYEPRKKVIERKTYRNMLKMMELVTQEGGTAKKAAIPGYLVAGKTGTSNKTEPQSYMYKGKQRTRRVYSKTKYFASFIGFVPSRNPRFVLLVVADEPQKKHYGGTVAGPTFKNIAERTLRYLDVKPTEK